MDAESYTKLALRVLACEATEGERRTLNAELSLYPAHREEFEQLRITHDILRTTAPMAEALRAKEPELPAHRVNELRTAVRQHFGPAANRGKEEKTSGGVISVLRWIFVGGGATALAVLVVLLSLSNRSVEVGLYQTDLVRNGDASLTPGDIPSARLITFEQDASFDQWQNRPLAWNEHARIWVDNEHDLLHILRHEGHGKIILETQPLASTNQGQRDQIKQIVESLQKQ